MLVARAILLTVLVVAAIVGVAALADMIEDAGLRAYLWVARRREKRREMRKAGAGVIERAGARRR